MYIAYKNKNKQTKKKHRTTLNDLLWNRRERPAGDLKTWDEFPGFLFICPRLKTGETNNPEKPMSANSLKKILLSSAKDQEGDSLETENF